MLNVSFAAIAAICLALLVSATNAAGPTDPGPNYVAGTLLELNDNGAWSWFMDERAIVHRGKLLVGSIRSTDKRFEQGKPEPRWGNCELAVHDLATGRTDVVVLHEHFEQDDHNGP